MKFVIVPDSLGRSPDILALFQREKVYLNLAVTTPSTMNSDMSEFKRYKTQRLGQQLSGNEVIDRLIQECSQLASCNSAAIVQSDDYVQEMMTVVIAYLKTLKQVHQSTCLNTDQLCYEFLNSKNMYHRLLETLQNHRFQADIGQLTFNFSLTEQSRYQYDLHAIDTERTGYQHVS